jgi:hypothetical protein
VRHGLAASGPRDRAHPASSCDAGSSAPPELRGGPKLHPTSCRRRAEGVERPPSCAPASPPAAVERPAWLRVARRPTSAARAAGGQAEGERSPRRPEGVERSPPGPRPAPPRHLRARARRRRRASGPRQPGAYLEPRAEGERRRPLWSSDPRVRTHPAHCSRANRRRSSIPGARAAAALRRAKASAVSRR